MTAILSFDALANVRHQTTPVPFTLRHLLPVTTLPCRPLRKGRPPLLTPYFRYIAGVCFVYGRNLPPMLLYSGNLKPRTTGDQINSTVSHGLPSRSVSSVCLPTPPCRDDYRLVLEPVPDADPFYSQVIRLDSSQHEVHDMLLHAGRFLNLCDAL